MNEEDTDEEDKDEEDINEEDINEIDIVKEVKNLNEKIPIELEKKINRKSDEAEDEDEEIKTVRLSMEDRKMIEALG